MNFTVESEEDTDGRWIAEVPKLPTLNISFKAA
jgi:hypothetical protein